MIRKRVLIGITGGIACYKICDLVSKLNKDGIETKIIMTGNSTEFVSPTTFETLSHNKVYCDTFHSENSYDINHISLSDWADIMLIAPASANIIAKLSQGIADDLLTTTYLAVKCPVLIAPAMNTNMLEHPATQANIFDLKKRGNLIIEPATGHLACNKEGKGRLASIDDIYYSLRRELQVQDFAGKSVLVTSGGTREQIDSVRFITNKSSGKMGNSLALAAYLRGATVELVSAATEINLPKDIKVSRCSSAADMRNILIDKVDDFDVLIMSAAVSDYTPTKKFDKKIKKESSLTIELTKTVDILKEIGKSKDDSLYLVGFAAETDNLKEYALSKLNEKNLDMIVANDVSDKRIGFDSNDNAVTIIKRNGYIRETEILNKAEVSNIILDEIIKDV